MAWQTGVAQSFDLIMYSAGVPTAPTGALAITVSKDGVDFGAAGVGTSVAQIGATPAVHVVIGAADANVVCGTVKIVDAGGAVDDRYETYTTEGNYTADKATAIETIAADVVGLDGDAMRGTDSAYTGTPPTAVAIATQVWANATGAAVAATLAGITSLAAWLRGLYRKSAMDATAKTEVNSGGGTYDEAADSNEALQEAALTGQGVANALKLAPAVGDPAAGSVAAEVDTLLTRVTEARLAELDAVNLPADVDAILADTGTAGVVVAAASKTGYALSAAGVQAIWDTLSSALTTVGSIGKRLVDYVDAAISSREASGAAAAAVVGLSTFDATTDEVTPTAASKTGYALTTGERTSIATAVWVSSTRTLSSFGTLVADIWAHTSALAIKAATDALAAIMPAGVFTANSLANAPTGGAGSGAHTATGTVADGATVFEGVRVAASNALGTLGPYVQYTDVNGEVAFSLSDDDWRFTAAANGAQGGGYEDVTITADDTFTIAVVAAAIPEPAPDGYCTVWCLAGTEGPDATTGTFYVSEIFSPEVYDPDGTPVEIVRGGTSMALVDGAAYRQVRQNAVVTFVLATPGKQKEWTRVVIPETAEAYVQNLVAEE